ncbi:MAG TPA: threonine-phosphate decarboxylase CobD [Xanthobacteraceae bacterium]
MFIRDADEPLLHGGDLAAARLLFPDAPEPFLDLSTGINPNSYPLPDLSADLFARLPQSEPLTALAAAAVNIYGAPSVAHVVCAPGTQILLPLVAGLVGSGIAAVVTPTYGEHARAATLAGHRIAELADIDAAPDADLVFVTNPNNPDGRLFNKTDLIALAKQLRARNGLVVVDEAFMDVGPPDASMASEVGRGNIVVLRSFGKFFGLAGARLGFALAAPDVAAGLRARLGPWAVSGPALAIATKALADRAWIEETRLRLATGIARLDKILAAANLEIIGGTTLFRLVRAHASALFQHLGRAGIFVRIFPENPSWLRFGQPAAEEDWRRLELAMAAFANRD